MSLPGGSVTSPECGWCGFALVLVASLCWLGGVSGVPVGAAVSSWSWNFSRSSKHQDSSLPCSPAHSQLRNGDGMEKWGWMDGEAPLSLPQKIHLPSPGIVSCLSLDCSASLVQQSWETKVWTRAHKNGANPPRAASGCVAQIQHLPCSSHLCRAWFWVLWSHPRVQLLLSGPVGVTKAGLGGLGGISKLVLFQPPHIAPSPAFQQSSDSTLVSTCWQLLG